jgi:hypothetical protein
MDIYISDDDFATDYIFDSGNSKNDLLYSKTVREQLKQHPKGFASIFDTEYYYRNRWHNIDMSAIIPIIADSKEYNEKKELENLIIREILKLSESFEKKFDQLYYSDRLMFNKEYQDFILDLLKKPPEELIIITDHFFNLTGDENIYSIIDNLLVKSKVYICYMLGDFGTKKFINNIKIKHSKNKNLYLKKTDSITSTTILSKGDFLVNIYINPIKLGKEIVFEEIPFITFNKEKLKEEFFKIKEIFDL